MLSGTAVSLCYDVHAHYSAWHFPVVVERSSVISQFSTLGVLPASVVTARRVLCIQHCHSFPSPGQTQVRRSSLHVPKKITQTK